MTINEVEHSKVKSFGTEAKIINDRFDEFKCFHIESWVDLGEGRIYVDDKITALKQAFPNYDSTKRFVREEKKGKMKKATEWNCQVIEENTRFIKKADVRMIQESIDHHRSFTLDNKHMFFYVSGHAFRDTVNDVLVYADLDNLKLINVVLEKVNQEYMNKWIAENITVEE